MFPRLFAESGLSLDRLRSLVEVGAAGSIVKAADGDPVKQSQYSRQIKELEDFFRTRLVERQGKGMRLTASGKELARISRFFMMGLSNFQRGCFAEEQTFRIGASATFIRQFLLPALSTPALQRRPGTYTSETADDDEIERRLHDLTLDFGIVARQPLSRPLQTKQVGKWQLRLWGPRSLRLSESRAAEALLSRQLPLALARRELAGLGVPALAGYPARLACDNFLEVLSALETHRIAGVLPEFLQAEKGLMSHRRIHVPELDLLAFEYLLAWNPRTLRLNPYSTWMKDALADALTRALAG